ncbi:MAG: hypothetical protein LQ339_000789 [Xanthoria mediterranea]|nr:MAG: hypothetical protein LQ339_000789 [Xanthoria mediterranea]
MADIYRSAAKVIVWLGPEANNSKAAIEALKTLASKIHVDWNHYTLSAASEEDAESEWVDLKKKAPFDQETWSSIAWLLDRSWFSRLWIWQEVKDARKGARTKDARCSNPRDKIYAVLNLMSEHDRRAIQPDYNKSTSEVFRDLMLTRTLGYEDLALLTICELQDDRGELPSWVPNLSVPRRCNIIHDAAAGGKSTAKARYSDKDASLVATGRCVGKILKVQQFFAADSSSSTGTGRQPRPRDVYAALKRLVSWIRNQLGIDHFDRQLEVICRTLICNKFSDTFEPVGKNSLDYQVTLEHFRSLADSVAEHTVDFPNSGGNFYSTSWFNGLNRSFIITEEGYIGMAPQTAHPGD